MNEDCVDRLRRASAIAMATDPAIPIGFVIESLQATAPPGEPARQAVCSSCPRGTVVSMDSKVYR
jgi:hypothetical protein